VKYRILERVNRGSFSGRERSGATSGPPPGFAEDDPVPIVIHHHGAGGYVRDGEADWLDTEFKEDYLKAVMEGGRCVIAGSHACGDHWGNPCAVEANFSLLRVLDNLKGIETDRLGLMGGGLGGALVWNSVLGPMEGRVKMVAVMQAVANLTAVIREQKFKAPCLRAYDLPEDTPDKEAIVYITPHDPMEQLRVQPENIPLPRTTIYHGAVDENIPPETNAKPLAKELEKRGAKVDLNLFEGIGHNVYGMGEPIEEKLKEFFSQL
jgi:acetyl esterase/lipase